MRLVWLLFCVVCSFSLSSKAAVVDITSPGDTALGVPDDNSWLMGESPVCAIDNNSSTKYQHPVQSGQVAGLRITPSQANLTVVGLTFTSANDMPGSDPVKFELYGSNTGINGTYELIVSGDIDEMDKALEMPRYTRTAPVIFDNSYSYDHYQILFPETRDLNAQAVHIAEVELLGYDGEGWPAVLDAGNDISLTIISASMVTDASITLYDNGNPDHVALEWQLVSAPAGVIMSNLTFTPDTNSLNTKIDFPSIPGIYELLLTATLGENVTSDYLTVVVSDTLCPTGDINQDCLVDIRDLEILAREWLNSSAVAAGLDGDFDGVDLDDFAVLANNWAKRGPTIVINEFMAVNTAKEPLFPGEILDEDHDSSDWIELVNVTDESVDLTGWYLTSDPTDLKQWEIPHLTLDAEDFYIIFASGKDRDVAGEELHTNFTLSSGSGFLALVEPDG
ncbi:MAG: lamin tail domain-containing protein, partial [Sedimentisphaerales bacterium]|nr:lamin tail domain-containing protein [Sedimentisphaerales bacterium]